MFSYIRQSLTSTFFNGIASQNSSKLSSAHIDQQLDDSESDEELNDNNTNGVTEKVSNEWFDEEWDAIEREISSRDDTNKHLRLSDDTVNGVVTNIANLQKSNEIVINNDHRCVFHKCTFGEISVGDLVHIENDRFNQVIVKPLRYKYLSGKITDFDKSQNRFIFSQHAVMRINEENKHLKVGDVVSCIVIEIKQSKYNWRAIVLPRDHKIEDQEDNDNVNEFINDLLDDKNGITVLNKIDFGSLKLNSQKAIIVWIKNKSDKPYKLIDCVNEEGENQISVKGFQSSYGTYSELPLNIQPSHECFVELECHAKYCGDNSEMLTFIFDDFKIGRFASVTVFDLIDTNSRYAKCGQFASKNTRRRLFGEDTWIVPGERLWQTTKHIHDKLERFSVPEKLWRALENNWDVDTVFPDISKPLTMSNYQNKFHALIYLEECDNHLNLRNYDMENVCFSREGHYLILNIPGLADGRPSLIISDKVICYNHDINSNENSDNKIFYEGVIHEIRRDDVMLRFNDQFHKDYKSEYFNVTFQMGRLLYRRCHHAIRLATHVGEQVLFPNKVILKKPYKRIPLETIQWHNGLLNKQQKLAVLGILRGECRPTPYIIFGPPGTGKTVTIVESILQVFTKLPHSRIIACTSANSSADLIAMKLLESKVITEKDLIRISAFHRVSSIPEAVQSVSRVADEDENKWLYYRIIVTTTCQSGIVFRYKILPTHFTHVFIDEAAQCWEPESLIPISLSSISHGCVVLAGDHHQLGPVCLSSKAKQYGLSNSLMERLMSLPPYLRCDEFLKYGRYNPKFITKLVKNYRACASIMQIPSQLFYDNELIYTNETDNELIRKMGFNFPAIFTGVKGEDRQDPDCPSWYNPLEILQCCTYLEKLYEIGVKPEDIGIITPYRKQVIRIRNHLRDLSLSNNCKIATIEEFQGLEKRVIIISMVRSVQQLLTHDLKYNLGFIYNPKRFNVAISRAMSLLICIGDPNLLSRDRHWKSFLEYCLQNNSYNGCKFRNYIPPSHHT